MRASRPVDGLFRGQTKLALAHLTVSGQQLSGGDRLGPSMCSTTELSLVRPCIMCLALLYAADPREAAADPVAGSWNSVLRLLPHISAGNATRNDHI
jgi:hypothetical protein